MFKKRRFTRNRPISAVYYFLHPPVLSSILLVLSDEPAHKVQILQPASESKPLPNTSHVASALTTPFASHAPTLRSEPIAGERILTVSVVATIFIKSLIQAVLQVISGSRYHCYNPQAIDAGVNLNVLQLLEEATVTTTTDPWISSLQADHTQLGPWFLLPLVESLLSIRKRLTYVLASLLN